MDFLIFGADFPHFLDISIWIAAQVEPTYPSVHGTLRKESVIIQTEIFSPKKRSLDFILSGFFVS